MPTSGRVTGPAVEANMEVTAWLMRAETIFELFMEDGLIDASEWQRIRETWREIRAAHRRASRLIEKADYHVERSSGWLKEDGPSATTNAKAKEHGLSVLSDWEMYELEEYDNALASD